jgi:citrate lyase subunit beta / citryl-CoA lyase
VNANRSYLYVPGHDVERLPRAFDHGADAVVFDLEDGVPAEERPEARSRVATALAERSAWVRVNQAESVDAEADLDAVARLAAGVRLPKVRSADHARWLVERVPGVPVICAIESAEGLCAARTIANVPGVSALSIGSRELTADLDCADAWDDLLHVRAQVVAACRPAAIAAVDSVFYSVGDLSGLREASEAARRLGFTGKSTLWPEQVAVINDSFSTPA